MDEKNIWYASVKLADVYGMSDARKKELVIALQRAVQDVCFKYGLHN